MTPTIELGATYEGRGGETHLFLYPADDARTAVSGVAVKGGVRFTLESATVTDAQAWIGRLGDPEMDWTTKHHGPPLPTWDSRVYFIADEDGYIKIGQARDPQQRLAGLQTGHRQHLTLLGTLAGGPAREADLHRRFAEQRVRGEWFSPSPELLALIEGINVSTTESDHGPRTTTRKAAA